MHIRPLNQNSMCIASPGRNSLIPQN